MALFRSHEEENLNVQWYGYVMSKKHLSGHETSLRGPDQQDTRAPDQQDTSHGAATQWRRTSELGGVTSGNRG